MIKSEDSKDLAISLMLNSTQDMVASNMENVMDALDVMDELGHTEVVGFMDRMAGTDQGAQMARAMLESITGKGGPLSRRLRNGLNSDDAAKAMMGRMVEMLSVPQSAQKIGQIRAKGLSKDERMSIHGMLHRNGISKTGLTKQVNQMAADIKSSGKMSSEEARKKVQSLAHLYSEGDKDTGDGIQTRGLKALNKTEKNALLDAARAVAENLDGAINDQGKILKGPGYAEVKEGLLLALDQVEGSPDKEAKVRKMAKKLGIDLPRDAKDSDASNDVNTKDKEDELSKLLKAPAPAAPAPAAPAAQPRLEDNLQPSPEAQAAVAGAQAGVDSAQEGVDSADGKVTELKKSVQMAEANKKLKDDGVDAANRNVDASQKQHQGSMTAIDDLIKSNTNTKAEMDDRGNAYSNKINSDREKAEKDLETQFGMTKKDAEMVSQQGKKGRVGVYKTLVEQALGDHPNKADIMAKIDGATGSLAENENTFKMILKNAGVEGADKIHKQAYRNSDPDKAKKMMKALGKITDSDVLKEGVNKSSQASADSDNNISFLTKAKALIEEGDFEDLNQLIENGGVSEDSPEVRAVLAAKASKEGIGEAAKKLAGAVNEQKEAQGRLDVAKNNLAFAQKQLSGAQDQLTQAKESLKEAEERATVPPPPPPAEPLPDSGGQASGGAPTATGGSAGTGSAGGDAGTDSATGDAGAGSAGGGSSTVSASPGAGATAAVAQGGPNASTPAGASTSSPSSSTGPSKGGPTRPSSPGTPSTPSTGSSAGGGPVAQPVAGGPSQSNSVIPEPQSTASVATEDPTPTAEASAAAAASTAAQAGAPLSSTAPLPSSENPPAATAGPVSSVSSMSPTATSTVSEGVPSSAGASVGTAGAAVSPDTPRLEAALEPGAGSGSPVPDTPVSAADPGSSAPGLDQSAAAPTGASAVGDSNMDKAAALMLSTIAEHAGLKSQDSRLPVDEQMVRKDGEIQIDQPDEVINKIIESLESATDSGAGYMKDFLKEAGAITIGDDGNITKNFQSPKELFSLISENKKDVEDFLMPVDGTKSHNTTDKHGNVKPQEKEYIKRFIQVTMRAVGIEMAMPIEPKQVAPESTIGTHDGGGVGNAVGNVPKSPDAGQQRPGEDPGASVLPQTETTPMGTDGGNADVPNEGATPQDKSTSVTKELQIAQQAKADAEAKLSAASDGVQAAQDGVDAAKKKVDEEHSELVYGQKYLGGVKNRYEEATIAMANAQTRVDTLNEQLDAYKKQDSDITEQERDLQQKIDENQVKQSQALAKNETIQARLNKIDTTIAEQNRVAGQSKRELRGQIEALEQQISKNRELMKIPFINLKRINSN